MKDTIMKLFNWKVKKEVPNDGVPPRSRNVYKGTLGYIYDEDPTEKENLSELVPPDGLEKFRKMRFNDPIIGGLMLRFENIFRTASYEIVGKNSSFVQDQLDALPKGFPSLINDMTSGLTYGFSINEKIWAYEKGKIILKDAPPRHQITIEEFTPETVKQSNAILPLSKCIHFVPIEICRNPYGVSLLRHVYKPYYYKSTIEAAEAQGIDRELGGLPVMTAPEHFEFIKADTSFAGYDPVIKATLDWAKSVVKDVRRDSSQGIIKPYGWELDLLKGQSSNGQNTNLPIARYNTEIAIGLLEDFAVLGAFASTNNANVEEHIKDFRAACDAWLISIANTLNTQLISDICFYNDLKECPKIVFNKLNHVDLDTITGFLARLCQQNIITPTEELEKKILSIAGLPLGKDVKKVFTKADLASPEP